MKGQAARPIPEKLAEKLCLEIEGENRGKWYTFNGLWCWGCATFSKGDPSRRCFNATPDHRGCAQVNNRFEEALFSE